MCISVPHHWTGSCPASGQPMTHPARPEHVFVHSGNFKITLKTQSLRLLFIFLIVIVA